MKRKVQSYPSEVAARSRVIQKKSWRRRDIKGKLLIKLYQELQELKSITQMNNRGSEQRNRNLGGQKEDTSNI